ncbi:MAG: cytochrome c [Planctomycetes bacterium]|nr:cytochrome c [Planctomycetota bacterium]
MRNFLLAALLSALACPGQSTDDHARPNFAEDVASILVRHCAACHRPGEAAPFPLLTFEDAKKRAKMIARVTGDRLMPPWHAATGHLAFVGERGLSDAEIGTLRAWVESGAPEGPRDRSPAVPEFPGGWRLGTPDLVLEMDEAFEVPADGPDVYRNFVLPLGLDADRWVRAIELRPSARKVVHHSLFFVDTSGAARAQDGQDGKPGFRGMGFASGAARGRRGESGDTLGGWGQLGGWTVGMTPQFLPDGLAMPLPRSGDIVLQTHFHPSGKVEHEKSTIGIWFGEKPKRTLTAIQLPPLFGALWGIDIPAGERRYEVRDSFVLPVAVDGVSIGGHAHYLCTDLRATATSPDGDEIVLLDVPRWDFGWQDRYTFAQPVRLPAGTRLDFVLHWDNSADNPSNPHDPPRRVRWGRESEDEMGSLTLQVVCADEADLPALRAATQQHVADGTRSRVAREAKQRVKELDDDGDGKVAIDRLPRAWRAIAQRADANSDGMLDAGEIDKADLGGGLRRR